MAHIYETPKLVGFVLSEAAGQRSRENITVTQSGAAIKSGTVLSRTGGGGAAVFALAAGATGDPTASAIVVTDPAQAGVYTVSFTAATKFDVEDPNGAKIGSGTTGVAFSKGGLAFTLTAGSTAAVAGDMATITVAAAKGKYVAFAANGSTGPAVGILYQALPAATGDVKAVGMLRDFEANRFNVTGVAGSAEQDLRARGVLLRGDTVLSVSTPAL